MSRRPRIGVTRPVRGANLAYFCIWIAVWLAGGRPVRLTSHRPRAEEPLEGLVLGGGLDIFPGLYSIPPKADYRYDHGRDEMEVEWALRARASGIPVLGICRGAQLMNVLEDGTLHLEVGEAYEGVDYPGTPLGYLMYRKRVDVTRGSRLHAALRRSVARVNSMHKQAIDRVGRGLVVTARERNGVIQAIEHPRRCFYLGVQFHPEFLIYRARFRRIFRDLIRAARDEPRSLSLAAE